MRSNIGQTWRNRFSSQRCWHSWQTPLNSVRAANESAPWMRRPGSNSYRLTETSVVGSASVDDESRRRRGREIYEIRVTLESASAKQKNGRGRNVAEQPAETPPPRESTSGQAVGPN